MLLDFHTLDKMRQNHPAWRLLASTNAPLVISFLQQTFIEKNIRVMTQDSLVEALEDQLFQLREAYGDERFPRTAIDYLDDWASPERGWLRKFYAQNSDEVQFDLTVATEKVINWLSSLSQRSFVGTESRLLILFDLVRQLDEGCEEDVATKIKQLKLRRQAIDLEIAQAMQGELNLLNTTAIKDRFMQFTQQARELLADFREVEHNFRKLDRNVRERIATWDGSKGELLQYILGERDVIADSDQGASFKAFGDFLMSLERQQQFSESLDKILALPSIQELNPDARLNRIHNDWLQAGEYTQRTVALLSKQLRRFLDDQAWLENKRIMEILHNIEANALEFQKTGTIPTNDKITLAIDSVGINFSLPMERTLFTPAVKLKFSNITLEDGDEDVDLSSLYSQTIVDKAVLIAHIQRSLQSKSQISLAELCNSRPLTQGLSELLAYLNLYNTSDAKKSFDMTVDEEFTDEITWQIDEIRRQANLARVIYVKK